MKVDTKALRAKLEAFETKHGVVSVKEHECVNDTGCYGCYKWIGVPARSAP